MLYLWMPTGDPDSPGLPALGSGWTTTCGRDWPQASVAVWACCQALLAAQTCTAAGHFLGVLDWSWIWTSLLDMCTASGAGPFGQPSLHACFHVKPSYRVSAGSPESHCQLTPVVICYWLWVLQGRCHTVLSGRWTDLRLIDSSLPQTA